MIRLFKFLYKFTGAESIVEHLSTKWFEYLKIFSYIVLGVVALIAVAITHFYFNMPNFIDEFKQIQYASVAEIAIIFSFFVICGAMMVTIFGCALFVAALIVIATFHLLLFIIKTPKIIKRWFNDCWRNSNQ